MNVRRSRPGRLSSSSLYGFLIALTFSGPAHADAPGPTDYESTITRIELPEKSALPDGVDISVEGHDAFLRVLVRKGTAVEISGYEDEPYLRIDANCQVFENQRSMSTWYNKERFGSDVDRSLVDEQLPPDWKQVGSNCAVAWHDHRLHYMSPSPPVNAEPGDVLVIDSIPLTISGIDVTVHVESVLAKRPSRVLPIAAVAFTLVVLSLLLRVQLASLATLSAAVLAVVLGSAQYLWSAPETGPQLTTILVPLIAIVACSWALYSRHRTTSISGIGAQLLGGVFLAVWAWQRAGVLTAALLPTSLPYFIDRSGTSVVATIAVFAVFHAVVVLGRLSFSTPHHSDGA